MSRTIEDDKEALLRTVAQTYALDQRPTEVELLAVSDAELIETDYDNWNGGTYGYTLYLRAPAELYVRIRDQVSDICDDIKARMSPLVSGYRNEWLEAVAITPRIEHDDNWRSNAIRWVRGAASSNGGIPEEVDRYDFFISHASEDKEAVVRPLAEQLRFAGFKVWYDEFSLTVGDSLRSSIDQGLTSSRYGIVVLSKCFFAKNWTGYELNGLVARQSVGQKVILPVWHEISREQVMKHSPSLADMLALDSSKLSLEKMVEALKAIHAPRV